MKKSLFVATLILAVILCFSFGVCAEDNPNQYKIDADITAGASLNDGSLWVGTLAAWQTANSETDTYFDNGEAIHEDDIILTNGKVGIVLAVGTRNPWGYPAGSVLDTGVVNSATNLANTTGGRDNTWSIEPLVNGWDSWAPENCGTVDFSIVKYDFDKTAELQDSGIDTVKVDRVYKVGSRAFDVITYYSIAADAEYAYMYTYMKNTAEASNVSVRFAVTNKGDDGGAMFSNKVLAAIGSYTKTDATEYSVGLTMPGTVETSAGNDLYVGKYGGSVGYKELRIDGVDDENAGDGKYKFAADEAVVFPCAIVISDTADFTKLTEYVADYTGVEEETAVSGTTEPSGTVIVKKGSDIYGWFIADAVTGDFSFSVPQDGAEYSMYLESYCKVDGEAVEIDNTEATVTDIELAAGDDKVAMTMTVTNGDDDPIAAKIEVFESADGTDYVSAYPVVRFNGDSIYYNNNTKGSIDFEVEPGYYKVVVYGEGYWFNSVPVEVKGNTLDGVDLTAEIEEVIATPDGQLSADLHHHSNKNDAFSAPTDVAKSWAASGLDVGFLSDHDFTTNNQEMANIVNNYADMSGFLPSEEISCSWAHFNVIPLEGYGYDYFLDSSAENHVMDQFSQLPEFVNQTHSHETMITANHPWYSYGLFYAYAQDAIPGGYTDAYDNIEINASCTDEENTATLISTTELWTSYAKYTSLYKDVDCNDVFTDNPHYLVGGSDTHDVRYPGFADADYSNSRGDGWYASGKVRTYALADTGSNIKETALNYSNAIFWGNSYVSFGPILDFGEDAEVLPGNYISDIKMNDVYEQDFQYGSVNGDETIYVLTANGDTNLEDGGITKVDFATDLYATDLGDDVYLKYDKAATEATRATIEEGENGMNSATMTVNVGGNGYNWAALLVVDGDGDYAITNPWFFESKFTDVPENSWYTEAVERAQWNGIANGYGDGTFRPLDDINRAEFCVLYYNVLVKYQLPEGKIVNENASFPDVKAGDWYYEAVTYMAQRGYLTGYEDKTFKPLQKITRAEMATVIYRVYGEPEEQYIEASFPDVQSSDWFYKYVMPLAYDDIIRGFDDGRFYPNSYANRAQAIVLLDRLYSLRFD